MLIEDWNYGSADDIDISTTDGAILDTELRPGNQS